MHCHLYIATESIQNVLRCFSRNSLLSQITSHMVMSTTYYMVMIIKCKNSAVNISICSNYSTINISICIVTKLQLMLLYTVTLLIINM